MFNLWTDLAVKFSGLGLVKEVIKSPNSRGPWDFSSANPFTEANAFGSAGPCRSRKSHGLAKVRKAFASGNSPGLAKAHPAHPLQTERARQGALTKSWWIHPAVSKLWPGGHRTPHRKREGNAKETLIGQRSAGHPHLGAGSPGHGLPWRPPAEKVRWAQWTTWMLHGVQNGGHTLFQNN